MTACTCYTSGKVCPLHPNPARPVVPEMPESLRAELQEHKDALDRETEMERAHYDTDLR